MTTATELPQEFSIVRVFLSNGSSYEATWTGEVWWLRRGALIAPEQVEYWENLVSTEEPLDPLDLESAHIEQMP
jgi:hypothetical protein